MFAALFQSSEATWTGGTIASSASSSKPKKKKAKAKVSADGTKESSTWDPFKEFVCCTQRDRLSDHQGPSSAKAPEASLLHSESLRKTADSDGQLAPSERRALQASGDPMTERPPPLPPPTEPPPGVVAAPDLSASSQDKKALGDASAAVSDHPSRRYKGETEHLMGPALKKKELYAEMPSHLDSARNECEMEMAGQDTKENRHHHHDGFPDHSARSPRQGDVSYSKDKDGNDRVPQGHVSLKSADDESDKSGSEASSLSDDDAYQKELKNLEETLKAYTKKKKRNTMAATDTAGVNPVAGTETLPTRSVTLNLPPAAVTLNPVVDSVSIPQREESERRMRAYSTGDLPSGDGENATAALEEESEEPSDGDSDNDEKITAKYNKKMCHEKATMLRERMKDDGYTAAQGHPGKRGKQQTNPHVDDFFSNMHMKLQDMNIKADEAEKVTKSFKKTVDPAEAVRDAVGKYYRQCEEIGILPPVPGRAVSSNDGLDHTQRKKLQHYIKDLLQEDAEHEASRD